MDISFNEPAASEEVAAEEQPQSEPVVEEPKAEPRKYKVKLDDQELEVDEDELLNGYQLSKASHKRFQEAAAAKRQAEEILSKVKGNPFAALLEMGLDVDELAKDYLYEKFQEEQMSPEQKRIKELEKSLAEKQAREQEEAAKREEMELSAQAEQWKKTFEEQFPPALSEAGLPFDTVSVREVAKEMQEALDAGYTLTPQQAAKRVATRLVDDARVLVSKMTDEQVQAWLGPEMVDRVRKMILQNAKRTPTERKPEVVAPKAKTYEEHMKQLMAQLSDEDIVEYGKTK